jgi:hypothetical protein
MKGEKWSYRSRPAIYLGNSTQYSRSVALVLSLTTGLVSPQYHAKFDDEFDTVTKPSETPVSLWQRKCHFTSEGGISTDDHHIPTVYITSPAPADVVEITPEIEENTSPIPTSIETPIVPQPTREGTTRDPAPGAAPGAAPEPITPDVTATRSGRVSRPPRSLTQDLIVYETVQDISQIDPEIDWMLPLAFASSADPDVMYLHEALKQPDKAQSKKWRARP